MGKRYLIDSNVVIDFSPGKMNEKGAEFVAREIDEGPIISVINKIELPPCALTTDTRRSLMLIVNSTPAIRE